VLAGIGHSGDPRIERNVVTVKAAAPARVGDGASLQAGHALFPATRR
jgi:hypothetical protein